MKTSLTICLALALAALPSAGRTLEVGAGKQYARLQQAAVAAVAGDTILLREGVYSGGDAISNLQGTETAWIVIRAADGEKPIFRGGSYAFQMSDAAYVRIEGLTFEQQTGNGVNIDDAGTFDTPAHHIVIQHCEWRSMDAAGNNDELKMSGVDNFEVRHCRFLNGSTGGSLIDMVGCHNGTIAENHFENGGSNCIQAKGGTSYILIEANKFVNGGERAVNIGGSTGLEFFRPQGVKYEAAGIDVYSNIFVGSTAPIAFVGAVDCFVRNNTIHRPGRWAVRILQETVGNGFLPCGDNVFSENIIVFSSVQPAVNLGSNTAPQTFLFSHNLWFHPDNAGWFPNTPNPEPARIVANPLFVDTLGFQLSPESPAIGAGSAITAPARDFYRKEFAPNSMIVPPRQRSVGAVEYYPPTTSVSGDPLLFSFASVQPNPASGGVLRISLPPELRGCTQLHCINLSSGAVYTAPAKGAPEGQMAEFDILDLPPGVYLFRSGSRLLAKAAVIR